MSCAELWAAVQQRPSEQVATQGECGSDLYLLRTPETTALLRNYDYKQNVTTFRSPLDNRIWYDIPFANLDWWTRRLRQEI